MNRAGLLLAFTLLPQLAHAWSEPARGSAERRAMMDALRPHAEWLLDAPVEFVVGELRVQGNSGMAMVSPQRPGGGAINLAHTPMVLRDGADPDHMDGTDMQALLTRQGKTWVVVHWAIGATDVWWADPQYCGKWGGVIPEVC